MNKKMRMSYNITIDNAVMEYGEKDMSTRQTMMPSSRRAGVEP